MPAVNATVRIEESTGDAIIALSTGGSGIASQLGSAWTRQRRAGVTPATVYGAAQLRLINPLEAFAAWSWLLCGWGLIFATSVLASRQRRRRLGPSAVQ